MVRHPEFSEHLGLVAVTWLGSCLPERPFSVQLVLMSEPPQTCLSQAVPPQCALLAAAVFLYGEAVRYFSNAEMARAGEGMSDDRTVRLPLTRAHRSETALGRVFMGALAASAQSVSGTS